MRDREGERGKKVRDREGEGEKIRTFSIQCYKNKVYFKESICILIW